jgi:hypothetical protein
MQSHIPITNSRRAFLTQSANGFGALALSSLLAQDAAANPHSAIQTPQSNNPLAPKPPHLAAKPKP